MANRDNRNRHNRGGYKSIGSQVGSQLGGHLSAQGKLGGGGNKGFNFSFNNFFKNFKPGYANTMGQVTGNLNQLNKPSAWKVKQFADKNIDITKMNKGFKVDIDTNRAIQGIKNEKVRNWLNKYTPKAIKDLRINHQMYSPTKVMPGDKGYNPTGTGSIQLDPDTERYLEWMATQNPSGITIADKEAAYANALEEGFTLQQAMEMNPAETMSFYALIDNSELTTTDTTNTTNQSTNNNETMAFDFEKYGVNKPNLYSIDSLNRSHNTDLIYQNIVGRNADRGGKKYWDAQIQEKGDAGYQDMVNTLLAGAEYKDRLGAKSANPNITEQELDRLGSAYVAPMHSMAGGAMAGWVPGVTLTKAHADAMVKGNSDQTNFTVNDILASNVAANNANNTALNTNLGGMFGVTGGIDTKVATDTSGGDTDGQWVTIHDDTEGILGSGAIDLLKSAGTTNTLNVGETLTNTGAGAGVIKNILDNGNIVLDVSGINNGGGNNNNGDNNNGDNNNGDNNNGENNNGENNNNNNNNGGNNNEVIIDGQTGEIISTNLTGGLTMDDLNAWWAGIDKSAWTGNQQQSGGLDNFMKFMMFMSMMRPQGGGFGGGGYGGSQYGYGGLNPGGVQSAYNPMDNFQDYMNNFKSLNTGLLN